jgi:hypothetical protein
VHPLAFFDFNVGWVNNFEDRKLEIFIKVLGVRTSVFQVQMQAKSVQVI